MSDPANAGLFVEGLRVVFDTSADLAPALYLPALTVPAGGQLAITGPSGSGKTTLIHALTGIVLPSAGHIRWGQVSITSLAPAARDRWRRETVGLVFQDFHLVPGLDIRANILLPLWFDHIQAPGFLVERAEALIDQLELPGKRRPVETLSRGEQQRVALARALVRQPDILAADEPTASLDQRAAAQVAGMLIAAAEALGTTLLITSHDPIVTDRIARHLQMDRGRILSDSRPIQ